MATPNYTWGQMWAQTPVPPIIGPTSAIMSVEIVTTATVGVELLLAGV